MPDCAVMFSNVWCRRLRYKRCLAVAATFGSATDPPSTTKMSIQPSSSKSKNSPPDPMISAKYFSGLAPLTCVTPTPAAAAMPRKATAAEFAGEGCWRAARSPDRARHSTTTTPIGKPDTALRHVAVGGEHDPRARVLQQAPGEVLHRSLGTFGALQHNAMLRHLLDVAK